ncbi:Octaprenyl-diphosphate synthase OS=Stutzerimonas stutzeri OX=316 GN=CXK95_03740 PE=3 SV=1 [Stutzerimonas stutzeri]
MMVELGSMPVMRIISQATRVIAEGEVLQLSKVRDASTTEAIYMEVIRGKTAMLFETSTHSAATLAGATAEQCEALRTFGDQLGIAFQLVDDLLTTQVTQKPWARTSATTWLKANPPCRSSTPCAKAPPNRPNCSSGNSEGRRRISESIRSAVEASGALHTAQLARDHVERAIGCLELIPANHYRDALVELSSFAIARTH